jgi:hypothetical protein
MSRDWQFSTVQDFLRQCNWQGTAQSKAQSKATPSPTSADRTPQTWQCQTVQTFFSSSNWNGQLRPVISAPEPVSTQGITAPVLNPVTLTATLPVNRFFDLFTWAAQPEIAAMPKLNALEQPIDSSDLNLSDFSDLF